VTFVELSGSPQAFTETRPADTTSIEKQDRQKPFAELDPIVIAVPF
jgi:hypothetical protein